jgi:hypothetical protein
MTSTREQLDRDFAAIMAEDSSSEAEFLRAWNQNIDGLLELDAVQAQTDSVLPATTNG